MFRLIKGGLLFVFCLLAVFPGFGKQQGRGTDYMLVVSVYAEASAWSNDIIIPVINMAAGIENLNVYSEYMNMLLIDNDTLDRDGVVRLVEHMIAGGVHGIFILGTTGEAQSLAYHLRYELTELVCSTVADRVPVLVGVTDTSLEESLRLGEKMMGNGAELLEKKRTKQKKPKKRRGRGDAFD